MGAYFFTTRHRDQHVLTSNRRLSEIPGKSLLPQTAQKQSALSPPVSPRGAASQSQQLQAQHQHGSQSKLLAQSPSQRRVIGAAAGIAGSARPAAVVSVENPALRVTRSPSSRALGHSSFAAMPLPVTRG